VAALIDVQLFIAVEVKTTDIVKDLPLIIYGRLNKNK
jgi:hypothetical protein